MIQAADEIERQEAERARVVEWLREHGYGRCETEDCDDSGSQPGGHKGACMGVVEDILRRRA